MDRGEKNWISVNKQIKILQILSKDCGNTQQILPIYSSKISQSLTNGYGIKSRISSINRTKKCEFCETVVEKKIMNFVKCLRKNIANFVNWSQKNIVNFNTWSLQKSWISSINHGKECKFRQLIAKKKGKFHQMIFRLKRLPKKIMNVDKLSQNKNHRGSWSWCNLHKHNINYCFGTRKDFTIRLENLELPKNRKEQNLLHWAIKLK